MLCQAIQQGIKLRNIPHHQAHNKQSSPVTLSHSMHSGIA
jgi:hypothetical protein